MVDHRDSRYSGHYTATTLSNEDQTWYLCDDTEVSRVEEPFEKSGTHKSRTACLLMYRAMQPQMPCRSSSEVLTDTKDEEKRQMGHTDVGAASAAVRTGYVEQSMTQTQRPPHGLCNQGATCYLNSVLQVLFMTTEIHHRLDPKEDFYLIQIFEDLKKRTCETKTITRRLGITDVHQQRDAAECLEMILQRISPQASEVFQGDLKYTTKCSDGHSINEETNPFWTLPLSLINDDNTTLSVERSLESIFRTKSFTGDNKVYCNQCDNATEAASDCEMVKSPQILTVLLKRFDFGYSTMSHVKSDRCVDVPRSLEIQDKTYKLYGMVNHRDSLYGGHYTATILSNEDQTWYRCNDSRVSRVEEPFEKSGTHKSRTACLLMYRAMQPQMPCRSSSEVLTDTKDEEKRQMGHTDVGAASAAVRTGYVEQSMTQTQNPPHGLCNQGATCYLNSVLQVLFMTTEIHHRLDLEADCYLIQIFEDLKKRTCETKTITRRLGITNVHQQRDAAECLEMILQTISPQASEVFQGKLRYTAKCPKCHSVYEKTDSVWTLPLSLIDGDDTTLSVERSLERNFQTKSLTGDKKLYCNQCNKTVASYDCEMVKSPQILTVFLKRFDFGYSTMSHVKSHRCVDVPRSLEIQDKTYKLYGMVNHRDSRYSGHYTATILSNEDQTWYLCDDTEVSRVEEPFEKSGTHKSRTACLLMYRAMQPQMPCRSSSEVLTDTKDEEKRQMGHTDVGAASAAVRTGYVEQSMTQTQNPPHGLYNQGATCYLNSVLQVLFMTTEIHHRLDPKEDIHLIQIFEDLKKRTCETKTITRRLGITNVYQQRDAAECLEMILQRISPQASEVFQGKLRYTAKCLKCHSVYKKTDSVWTLPLSLIDGDDTTLSVERSLESIFQTKSLTGDKKLYCNQCNKTVASYDCEMVKSPQILILLLKRFDFGYSTMSHVKSDRCVDVPRSLEIQDKTYKLYGMVDHRDSRYSGHYTATTLSNEDQTWYLCDDTEVSRIEEPFEKSKTLKSRTACLLMYRAMQPQMPCRSSSEVLTDTKDEEKRQMGHTDVGAASAAVRTGYVEQSMTQTQNPPHGLYNQGATCYLNSVLQVLFMTTEIHHRLDLEADCYLIQIFEDLKKRTCETKTITRRLGITNVHQQRDAAECLEMILQRISPQASEVFQGKLRYTAKCLKCHSVYEKTDSVWTLPLSLIDGDDTTLSVERSLERNFQTKSLTGDKKLYCNQCNKTVASYDCEMVKSPQILTVFLKRFDFGYSTMSHVKSHRCVDVPRSLEIQDKTYKLYGMVDHRGSRYSGHYTATILSNEDQTWYLCDDTEVSRVEEPFEKSGTHKSRTACLLMYRAMQPQMPCRSSSEVLTDTKDEEKRQMGHTDVGAASAAVRTGYVEQSMTQTQNPPHGLCNQGATCYLNSVLQVLFMSTEIHHRLDLEADCYLIQIFEDLKKRTCETKTITRRLGITNVHQQRDAAECLEMILQRISPQASEVFQGKLRYTAKCPKCHSVYKKTDSVWTLPLSLIDGDDTTLSVERSLESIFQTKSLTGDKKLYCNQCDKTVASYDCEMVKSPQILILLLKRFDFGYSTMSHVKSDRCVDVPRSLEIQDKTYKLYGMVDHRGSRYSGHYTATTLSNEDQTWYLCDDSRVSRIEEPFEKSKTLKSRTACLLMYRAMQPQMPCRSSSEVLTDTKDEEKRQMGHTDVGAASAAVRTGYVERSMTQTQNPPHGLCNQGATCYLNSVLQVLFMTTEIHHRLDPKEDFYLIQIFEDLKKRTCETKTITTRLWITNVHQQRDAAECLEMILQRISPQASEVFQGKLRYTAKCLKCHSVYEKTDSVWTLPLSLIDGDDTTLSVERSLESIFQTKSLTGDKKLYCNQCNKTVASYDCEMVKSPQILTVLLKRFDFGYSTMSHVKSDRCVDVPRSLEIQDKTYELYGMVDHRGSRYSGHYTATTLSNEDQTWYLCDDTEVSRIEEPFEKSGTHKSRTACLLMYRAMQPQMPCRSSSEVLTVFCTSNNSL
ncbi:uncharacterized protein [Pempheris klunzingeri]|uniref:uncharacterized protein isoform X2 n=1 Tax=Pempheris klunzingeri TaxID=3127111 RepID=UPI003980A1FA